MSPVLDERHDLAHPVEGDEAWSESYYFNAYDPDADVGFFTRIGVRPNEGTMDVGFSVWIPGGGLATVRGIREQHEMTDTELEVAGVRYERVAPMREWRLLVDADSDHGPVGAEVTFRSLMPAIGADGQGRAGAGASDATRQSVGKGHLEQAGRWSGWIEVGGQRLTLGDEARGNRDKSWGPRRWGGPTMWRWFSVNIGDDTHFGGIRIGTEAGDLHRGWVWTGGEGASIRTWDVKTELEGDGLTHRVTHVTATDKRDRVHHLRGDLLRVAPVHSSGSTVVNEGLARWTYEGRTGYGISEYLHQLDADGRPKTPIE